MPERIYVILVCHECGRAKDEHPRPLATQERDLNRHVQHASETVRSWGSYVPRRRTDAEHRALIRQSLDRSVRDTVGRAMRPDR